MTLRNEIIAVKELSKRFVSAKYKSLQLTEDSTFHTIEKSLVKNLGYTKVIGLQIQDVKNDRFDASKVGTVSFAGMRYTETEFMTITKWIYE